MASNKKNFELAFKDDCVVRLRSALLHLSLVCSLPELRAIVDSSLSNVFSEASENVESSVTDAE